MKYNKLLMVVLAVFLLGPAYGQYCGNIATQSDIDRLLMNREVMHKAGVNRSPDAIYVPVTFHVVRETDGSGGVNEEDIIAQMCALNVDYAEQNITFYFKDKKFNYINDSGLYNNPTSQDSGNEMIVQKLGAGKNSMNVFITENADTGNLGTTLGYYDPFRDFIVIRKADVNEHAGTLSHEVGHFFSLLHCHSGWDSEPWSASDHGNPINSQFAPGGKLAELVDGSNCEEAGDFLCDTPADYNLGFGWSGCSTYNGGCMDFAGELLDPQEVNIMGYFIGCSQYLFSPEQQGVVRADFESGSRSYIRSNYVPNLEPVEETTLQYPIGGEDAEGYDWVHLDWTTMPNAVGYLIELRTGATKTYYNSEKSDILLQDLDPNRLYYWKVLAYSEIGGCGSYIENETFRTGSTTSVDGLADYELNIFPTVIEDQQINIEIADQANALVEIINVSGQKVQSTDVHLVAGVNSFSLNSNVSQGMYFVTLIIDNKRKTFKVIAK